MRLESVKIRGFGSFRREFSVDLTALAGPLVAVVGRNGVGKSTLLELALPGACYRDTPTRGSLNDLAVERDAFLESRIVYGKPYTLRHVVDSMTRKGEAVVLGPDGPVLPDSKLPAFKAWAAKNLPAPEVLYAAMFSPQGAVGFLGMDPAPRKAVLLRVLGVERLEKMAERARECVKATKAELATMGARITDERARGGDLAEVERQADVARQVAESAALELAAARAALMAAEADYRQIEQAEREREAAAAKRDQLTGVRDAARSKLSDLEGRIANNQAVLAEADRIHAAVARVAELRAEVVELERAEIERQHGARERSRLEAELALKRQSLAEIEGRIANNRAALAEADQIGEAVERVADIRARVAKLDQVVAEKRADVQRLESEYLAAEREWTAAQRRADGARGRLQGADVVARAVEALAAARARVASAAEVLATTESELERLRGQRVSGAEDRIVALRGGLDVIAGGAKGAAKKARETLDLDDATAKASVELPAAVREAEARHGDARIEKLSADEHLSYCERTAARGAEIDAARAELAEAEREGTASAEVMAGVRAQLEMARAEVGKREADARALRAELAELEPVAAKAEPLARAGARLAEIEPQAEAAAAERDRLAVALAALPAPVAPALEAIEAARAEIASIEPVAAKAEPLARAEVRLAELEPQAAVARAELAQVGAALAALPPPAAARALPDLVPARARTEQGEIEDRRAHSALALAEQQLEASRLVAARLAELEAERARFDAELADWNRLAADFGRDGLQAAEIDSAGPELTALVNDLLHSCVGPRFSVSIETTKLSSDGRRQLEGCEVRVLDTVAGREAEGKTFSGGEKVIIAEAISLALSMLACRRAGLEGMTLVRDESGAALDPAKARAYVAMLRRAAQIVRADKVLFVSHSDDVIAMADDRIEVSAGAEDAAPALPAAAE